MAHIGEIMYDAIEAGDVEKVRQLFKQQPEMLSADGGAWLNDAAKHNNVSMVKMIVELGVDPNSPRGRGYPTGALSAAAGKGCLDVARFLLDREANVNGISGHDGFPLEAAAQGGSVKMVRLLLDRGAKVNIGGSRAVPLAVAASSGFIDIVRLLLENGADPNVIYGTMDYGDPPRNALLQATINGHEEVAALLRAHGAVLPPSHEGVLSAPGATSILDHITEQIGPPNPVALHELVPGDPAISIYVIPLEDRLVLVTCGMSDKPIRVPAGAEEYQYAELVIHLPRDWPLTDAALQDPNFSWPIDWLRRLGHYPHEHGTWLGGPIATFGNEEPPQPFAPSTKLSCFLANVEDTQLAELVLSEDKKVMFYTLFPLYAEERDLARAKGMQHLLEVLQRREIGRVIDVRRPNVAM